jgi:site-specific DNA-cytosine methylase
VITDQLGVHPIELNSALDSAQSRKRLYWASWGIMPQIDKGIVLSDILEDFGQADLVGKQGKVLLKENIEKASCLLARDYKGFGNQGQTGVRCIEVGQAEEIKGHDVIRRVYSPNGKSPTLNTMGGGNREPKVAIGAFRGRYLVDGKRQDHKMKTKGLTTQRLEVRGDSKSNTLTTVQKDNVVVNEDIRWRALTPIECERLQTVEDNATLYGIDENGKQITISKTQRYKMLGNGWCVDTIAHILSYLEGRI